MGRITKPALLYRSELDSQDCDGNPNDLNITPRRLRDTARDISDDGDGQLYEALTLETDTWMPIGIGQ